MRDKPVAFFHASNEPKVGFWFQINCRSWLQVLMVAVAVIMMVLLRILFCRTKAGLTVRAVALDYRTARLMG